MTVRDLAEEIATERVAITRETSRGRAEYAAKRRSEWDAEIPAFEVVHAEALRANDAVARATRGAA